MQNFEFSSIFLDSLGTLGALLTTVATIYFLMMVLDVEASRLNSIPLISLGLGSTGFALLSLLFVHTPSWLGANPLSWFWAVVFAFIWALGSASSDVLSLLTILSHYLLLQSQYSTDVRGFWERIVSEPHSLAIAAISMISALLILVGFRVGAKLRESFSQLNCFLVLLSAAISGLFVGGMLYSVIQLVNAVVT
jgi:hypothetical protein